jgi:HD-GYP domain-containing protein (c-di-GMP phosphodiesterase class II)
VTLWDKPAALTPVEWQRMQRHPSVTELVLACSAALGPLGTLAGLHHERLDGSGYRHVPAAFIPLAARVLAVADAYQTKTESRPHRAPFGRDDAAHWLRSRLPKADSTEGRSTPFWIRLKRCALAGG